MNNFPLVSVIIPTYKRSEMLPRAIESVLNQDYINIQIVVVDDNNPESEWREKTQERMCAYSGNKRVKYICHNKNLNGSVARNTGIFCSDGEIITFLDDDDIYRPNKVSEQVNYLMTHPEFRAVYCGWNRGKDILPIGEGDLSFGILSGSQILITNSLMMWKSDAINCGGFDPVLRRHQEASLMLNYFEHGGLVGRVDKILVDFDVSDRTNVTSAATDEKIIKYLLKKYANLIYRNELRKKNSASYIVSYRGMALMYDYILEKRYFSALRKGMSSIICNPIRFPMILFNDICNRIKNKK